jgi:hypothetical protein
MQTFWAERQKVDKISEQKRQQPKNNQNICPSSRQDTRRSKKVNFLNKAPDDFDNDTVHRHIRPVCATSKYLWAWPTENTQE